MSKGTVNNGEGATKNAVGKKYSMVAARIPIATKAKLLATAKKDGRTMSLQIAFAIKQFLESRK